MTETDYSSAVALIGMSGRFPGAGSAAQLWRNLTSGTRGLRELGEDELRDSGIDPGLLADPRYVRVGGPVADLDRFDATVFGINPREAETMDPQHRLFLECSWEALEGAGYCPTEVPCQVAVFAGCGFPDYVMRNIEHLAGEPGGQLLMAVGNERDSLASLVSYKLDLRGPAMTVQTFCSTSLVSVHMACQSLLTYECDIALAGGAFTPLPEPAGYLYEQGGIMSPDGRVRSFDADANGTVMGAGVGTVALKRMADAIADGDIIHAVILGSAVNNDGRSRAGYTAPGVDGEAEVIRAALDVAGVGPETVGYVECHATGTMLGDSIELAALNRVFGSAARTEPCVLGSLKPMIGHLDRASGVTGLMRAAMALGNEVLPGVPDYRNPNPALASASDRFTVLTGDRPWAAGPHPRRAGVSSFGLGGTNAHVVLEQAPPRAERPARPGPHLLVFSAAGEAALTAIGENLAAHLGSDTADSADLADVAYTLQISRGGFARRRAVVVADRADAVAALADPERWVEGKTQRRNVKVRLVPDPDVPAAWWTALREAVERLLGPVDGATADGPGVLAAALARLGIAVAGTGGGAVEEFAVAPDGRAADEWLLAAVAELWIAGCPVDWSLLHGGAGRRVPLPTYPFQRRRYWIDPKPAAAVAEAATEGKTFDRDRWTYLPAWEQRPLAVSDLGERVRMAGPWLVMADDPRGEALVEHLVRHGADVIAVRPGAGFGQDDRGDFTVRVDSAADFTAVFGALLESPRTVVHGFSLAAEEAGPDPLAHFAAEQVRGFYSALALCRELAEGDDPGSRTELVLLTSGAVGVAGADQRHPEHAALASLAPSLAQENPRVRARSVDVGEVATHDEAGLEVQTTRALAAMVCDYAGPMAVRGDDSWLRTYQPHPVPMAESAIQPGDTVLITGGLGDVGLTLSRHLADKYGCKLVLTVRSPLPPREEWAEHLAAVPAGGERSARHIRNILDLEERGATVLTASADVSDKAAMRAVVDAAVAEFGGIDVVVHGAGVQDGSGFGFAHAMDRAACEAHFAAKVGGFHVLQEVLGEHAKDRRITLSSVSVALGGITLGPYTSANAALDAYARAARSADAGRWVSVNWDTWNIDAERLETHSSAVMDFAMAPAEGVDVFERALAAGDRVGHVVISTGSLDARVAKWVVGDIHAAADDEADDRDHHPRPELDTPFVAPREGTEARLCGIWTRVLSIEPIGALDNFFELGGNSLLAIEMTARIRKVLKANVAVTALLVSPTVRDLAARLDAAAAVEDIPTAVAV
ncbi:SDR family NAD(P)-dependent oxidoreductase [Actinokineospora sp. 24-640]